MRIMERCPGESAREYAYRVIRENIVSLDLEPGSPLSDMEVSAVLGVSRTPVREAIMELLKCRIVEVYPQKGSFIGLIDTKLVNEARFLRMTLEKAVAVLACRLAKEEDFERLLANVRLQGFYLEHPAPGKLMELDNEFHRNLFTICEKDLTYQMYMEMEIHYDRVRSMSLHVVKDLKVVEDHKEILKALMERKEEDACRLIERHLNRYEIDEVAIRQEYPQYFKDLK